MFILFLLVTSTSAGFTAVGICYAGCAVLACACFGVTGYKFGTVVRAEIAAVPALAICNAAFSKCMSACWVAIGIPTP